QPADPRKQCERVRAHQTDLPEERGRSVRTAATPDAEELLRAVCDEDSADRQAEDCRPVRLHIGVFCRTSSLPCRSVFSCARRKCPMLTRRAFLQSSGGAAALAGFTDGGLDRLLAAGRRVDGGAA